MTVLLSAQDMKNLTRMRGLVNLPESIVESVKEFNEAEFRWRNEMDQMGTFISYIVDENFVEQTVLSELHRIIPIIDEKVRILMHGHSDIMLKVIEPLNGIGHRAEFINNHPNHELVSRYFEEISEYEQSILDLTNNFLEVV